MSILVWMRRRIDVLIFVLGLASMAFAGGLAVSEFRVFPHQQIRQAWQALRDWRENWQHKLGIRSMYLFSTERTVGGATIIDEARIYPGYTFLTMQHSDVFGAALIDMEGNIVQRWDKNLSEVWPDPTHLDAIQGDSDNAIHGAALLGNGDAILDMGGIGTVRLDRCSEIVWTIDQPTHHSVDILADGELLIPARYQRRQPDPETPWLRPGKSGFYFEDTVIRADLSTGEVIEEFSIIDAFVNSGTIVPLLSRAGHEEIVEYGSPFHLNDAEALRPEMAEAFPLFEPGDIMISLRNISTIAVIDKDDKKVKWHMTGPFHRQHDPDFLPNGNILLYDNRRSKLVDGKPSFGWTRLIEIDPQTRSIVWEYEDQFYVRIRGMQQPLPNGNILFVEPNAGRVVELAKNADGSADIVWEYVNLVEPGSVGIIIDAQRVAASDLTFLDAPPCP